MLNKFAILVPVLIVMVAVSGCTSEGGGLGPTPESLNWCVPGDKWTGYVDNVLFSEETIHGISNMYGDWKCHVQSQQDPAFGNAVIDFYMTDEEASDVWVKITIPGTGIVEVHLVNDSCVAGDCSEWVY